MIETKNQFLELLNNKDKARSNSLIVWLHGSAEGKVITDLQPAQEWCFDTAQSLNKCYTVRYRADGSGSIIGPLIRQFCEDVRLRSKPGDKRPGTVVGNFQVEESTNWKRLETAVARQDASANFEEPTLIEMFGSTLHSALPQGHRLVFFCEIDKTLAKGDLFEGPENKLKPNIGSIGLDYELIDFFLQTMPERVVLVIAGIEKHSTDKLHDAVRQLETGPDYLLTQPPEERSQRLLSDAAEGEDKLNIVGEVNALADAIAARDLEPPLVVGILGGWGSGKSYVMHLLKQRLLEIRGKDILDHKVRESSPYVGHFYLVHFDAWTYAKADLWASLMQEVLTALNDQISFEQLGIKPALDPPITPAYRQLFDYLESKRREDGGFDYAVVKAFRDQHVKLTGEAPDDLSSDDLKAQHDALRKILIPEDVGDYQNLIFLEKLFRDFGDASSKPLDRLKKRFEKENGKPPSKSTVTRLRKHYRDFVENLPPVIDEDHQVFKFLDELLTTHGSFDAEALKSYREKYGQPDDVKNDEQLAKRLKKRHESLKNKMAELKHCAFDHKFQTLLCGKDNFGTDVVDRIKTFADTKTVLDRLDKDNVLWSRLQGLNEELRDELTEVEKNLKDKKLELSRQQTDFDGKAEISLQREHWQTFADELAGQLGLLLKAEVKSKLDKIEDDKGVPVSEAMASIQLIDRIRASADGRTIIAFLVFALGTSLAVSLASQLDLMWTGLSGSIIGLLGGTAEAWHKANEFLKEKVDEFEAFDKKMLTRQNSRRQALVEKYQAETEDFQQLCRTVAELESKFSAYHEKIGLTAGHPTLLDFISDRLHDEEYEERLGPLQQVQEDIRQLSSGLRHKELCVEELPVSFGLDMDKVLFPRGLPRVVLFIDDLDRCPPDRVVEVLEAAQLLVKTNLFVVVMAMDVRYITKALEKSYTGVLDSRGDPSGLDYIEKIVQIPYRIRPISEEAMPNYLRSQMLIKVEETGTGDDGDKIETGESESSIFPPGEPNIRIDETVPQKVLEFDEAEVALIQNCALITAISPRATKRLVNVMKLIKIIWYRTGEDDISEEVKKAVVFFLALSARCALIMRRVLLEMEKTLAEGDRSAKAKKLPVFIAETLSTWREAEGRRGDWDFLEYASKKRD